MREIILDTETTGVSIKQGHKIIEIGAVELKNKLPTGRSFHSYLNPKREVSKEAYKIHGISDDFLKNKPVFQDIAESLLNFVSDGYLVMHNASFDVNFLNHELNLVNKDNIDQSKVICSLELARKLYPGTKVNLNALCKKFKISLEDRVLHGALKDARLLAQVYSYMTQQEQSTLLVNYNLEEKKKLRASHAKNLNKNIIYPTQKELSSHKEMLQQIKNNLWFKIVR